MGLRQVRVLLSSFPLGARVASLALPLAGTSFVVAALGAPGWGVVGMFSAVWLVIVGLGLHSTELAHFVAKPNGAMR